MVGSVYRQFIGFLFTSVVQHRDYGSACMSYCVKTGLARNGQLYNDKTGSLVKTVGNRNRCTDS